MKTLSRVEKQYLIEKHHGKLFRIATDLKLYKYSITYVKDTMYREEYNLNYYNPLILIYLLLYSLYLLIFISPLLGISIVKTRILQKINKKSFYLNYDSTDKIHILEVMVNLDKFKAAERYLSRVYNIHRDGQRYKQDYFTPEDTYGLCWDIENNDKKITLLKILSDISAGKVESVCKISINEIIKKFKLSKNPGLIKIVKNKQTDKGFKVKYFQ